MCKTNVRDIVCEWLEDSEFDGLVSDFDCGCLKSDLMPCGNPAANCEPAYRFDCALCSKAHCCHLRTEGCGAWVMFADKNHCATDYIAAQPALQDATAPAAPYITSDIHTVDSLKSRLTQTKSFCRFRCFQLAHL